MPRMILVTGGTGFVGQALLRKLAEYEYSTRMLLRPSLHSPSLPRGVDVQAAICSFQDPDGLRSAFNGVKVIYHLASSEWRYRGKQRYRVEDDAEDTRRLCQAAVQAGVERIFYVSHLGAELASAYPLLRSKAVAEDHIRRSGLDYTIIRSAIAFGQGDHFTTYLARLIRGLPFIFLVPGDGENLLQPLWVEDLATCLVWAQDLPDMHNQVLSIGGPEMLTFNQVAKAVMNASGAHRRSLHVHAAYMRMLTHSLESGRRQLPTSEHWLDYLSANRICALDAVPRLFKLIPSRFEQRLEHLRGRQWRFGPWKRRTAKKTAASERK